MRETTDQGTGLANNKKKSPLSMILVIILMLLLATVGYYYYIGKVNIANNSIDSQQSEDIVSKEESVFGKITDGGADLGNTDNTYVKMTRNAILNAMLVDLSVFKVSEDEINRDEVNPYLPDNCIVLKYIKSGNDSSLVLIGTSGRGCNYKIGESVDFFNYRISANTYIISADIETKVYKKLNDFSKVDLRDNLKPGSRLVFSCSSPCCNDGSVSWVLILSEDLNL